MDIVKAAEDRISQSIIYTTPDSSPTNRESLRALHETLTDLRDILSLAPSAPRTLEEIVRATADFQFGSGAGYALIPDNARLGGKPYRQIICRVEKEQVCSFIADAGILSLTLTGGQKLASLGRYGVSEADYSIRPGDEVIVLNNQDDVIGVGRSEMSGREMCELKRGRAVSVRHKMEGE